jgi:hypothetical protein
MCKRTCEVCYPRKRARMPRDGDIAHTKLSDGRVVLRGSEDAARDMFGNELVK